MGAVDALDEFVEVELSGLRRTALLLTGSWTRADGAVEDALFTLLRKGTDFADGPRAVTAMRREMVAALSSADSLVDSTAVRAAKGPAQDPSDRLLTALASLPVQQRAAVVLGWFAKASDAEVQAALGVVDAAALKKESIANLRAELARTGDQLVLEDEVSDGSFARPSAVSPSGLPRSPSTPPRAPSLSGSDT